MITEDFEKAGNLHEYWLTQDALHPVNYDVYFSLGTRYYCAAGCKICYIDKNFKSIKPNLNTYFPKITQKHEDMWQEVFSHFLVVRTNDDMLFLKLNYPDAYRWYQENAHNLEYCFTDNAIFRTAKILDTIKFKALANISISSSFLKAVNPNKLMDALERLNDKSPILKLKFIDDGYPELFAPYIELANKHNMDNIVHHNFLGDREVLEHEWAQEQTTWVDSDEQGLMQIYRESVHLYFDRWYYSSDDASDLNEEAFHQVEGDFDREAFLTDLLLGKQKAYKKWASRTKNPKFRDYFNLVDEYNINSNFNFIPGLMIPPYSKYCYKLLENGWVKTKYGLVKPNDGTIVPILGIK